MSKEELQKHESTLIESVISAVLEFQKETNLQVTGFETVTVNIHNGRQLVVKFQPLIKI